MLNNAHYYYKLNRKYVTLFGSIFNNITLKRIKASDSTEVERFKVPIIYGPKEKYVTRLQADPDLDREVSTILPRMSFEMTNMQYDPTRKQNSLLRASKANSSTRTTSSYMGVPYDITFDLNIYVRNIDDGNQIIEQILPYFGPDYTVTVDNLPDIGITKDVPIILNAISESTEYEGNFDSVRYVTWNLNFTMKVYYYGPITYPKIIRTVITNIYNDPELQTGYIVRINTGGGSGVFRPDDYVYQGDSYSTANAYGIVIGWSGNTGKLQIGGTQGSFKVGQNVHAVSTNGVYTISSFDATPLKLAEIVITPDPSDALPNSDFGYSTTINEWPNID